MEHITMNRKEREQLIVFAQLKKGGISQKEAALKLKISPRWVRKKYKRYQENGAAGIVHANRNRESKRRWSANKAAFVVDLLRSDWHGFGPTFTAELLAKKYDIHVSKETLRQVMIKAGVWLGKKHRMKHRKRRERKQMLGVMVQADGSPHDWFEGRAPWCTLIVFIDDATSQILWLEFVKSESLIAVMQATKNYMVKYGAPQSFYVDHGSVFSVNNNNSERDKITEWERVVSLFSTKVQHANSPQAKGRVERANQTLQDRLVKEMRLAGISSIEKANDFLQQGNFIQRYNEQFAIPAAQPGNAHGPVLKRDLDVLFCIKDRRVLANDYTISFNKRILQLAPQQRTILRPKDIITVSTYLDHSIELSIRKTKLEFYEISHHPQKQKKQPIIKEYKPCKPSANSRRWVAGLAPISASMESRMKTALPAAKVT